MAIRYYDDVMPVNARVFVRYKPGESVRFEYPVHYGRWKAMWKFAYAPVQNACALLAIITLVLIAVLGLVTTTPTMNALAASLVGKNVTDTNTTMINITTTNVLYVIEEEQAPVMCESRMRMDLVATTDSCKDRVGNRTPTITTNSSVFAGLRDRSFSSNEGNAGDYVGALGNVVKLFGYLMMVQLSGINWMSYALLIIPFFMWIGLPHCLMLLLYFLPKVTSWLLPRLNYYYHVLWFGFLYSRDVKKQDLVRGKDGHWYASIPSFNNVILDYKTTGDVGRRLEGVTIMEHDMRRTMKVPLLPGFCSVKDEYHFFALFDFGKGPRPVGGLLSVKWL